MFRTPAPLEARHKSRRERFFPQEVDLLLSHRLKAKQNVKLHTIGKLGKTVDLVPL